MDTLSYKEMAAEYPNIPPTTFRKWKSIGKLNPVDFDGLSPRFARVDVEVCVQNHKPEKNGAPGRKRQAALRKATLFNDVDMPADGDGIKEAQSVVGDAENFQSTNGQLEEAEPVKTTNANGLDTANGEVNTDAKNDSGGQVEETPDTNADKDNPQKGKEVDVQDGDASTLDTNEPVDNTVDRLQMEDVTVESSTFADKEQVTETALTVRAGNTLPATLEELSQFVLFNEEKVKLARAAIKTMTKLNMAKEVVEEKLREAQDIADLVALAKIKFGELLDALPKSSGARTDLKPVDNTVDRLKTKSEAITELGLNQKQAERLQTMARNPDAVHAAMAKARESGDIVSQSQILNEIKQVKKKKEVIDAKKSVAAQYANAEEPAILFVGNGIGFVPTEPYKLLLTDPPYSTDVDDIDAFAQSWLPNALNHVRRDGFAYVFVGAYPDELKAYLNVAPPEHLILEQILVWTYRNTLGVNLRYYKQNWQASLFYRGVDAPAINCPVTNEQWAVQDINAPDGRLGNRYHTWQKPDEIAERFIRHSTQKGDTVFDPFACTGTFLLAAAKLSRKAYGFEINPDNAATAFSRGCKNSSPLKEKETN